MLITEVVETRGKENPNRPATVCGGVPLKWRELRSRIRRLAETLKRTGVKAGDAVGILLPNCAEYTEAFVAPLWLGAVSVPLNVKMDTEDLKHIFQDARLSALIVTNDRARAAFRMVSEIPEFRTLMVNWRFGPKFVPVSSPVMKEAERTGEDYGNLPAAGIPAAVIRSEDPAVFVYTSGTTGRPKGVVIDHGTIARRAENTRNLDISSSDICYSAGSLHHNGKLFVGLIRSLYLGMPFHTDTEFHPRRVLKRLASESVTFFHASPYHFGVMAHWDGFEAVPPLPRLRICLSSGNRMDEDVKEKFLERFGVPITENYGITEAGGLCTDGFPHDGVSIRIVDETGYPKSAGEIGEIAVTGREMSGGYLNQPNRTAAVFRDGWFYTGDLGYIDAEGRLHIRCRKKNALEVKGETLYPESVQEALLRHDFILDALVRFGTDGRPEAHAVLDSEALSRFLLKALRKEIPDGLLPPEITFCRDLPHVWREAIRLNAFDRFSP